MSSKDALLVLVAGPYRSGTDDDPAKLAANVEVMNRAGLDVFLARDRGKQVFTSADELPRC
jgi:hypothetical protein